MNSVRFSGYTHQPSDTFSYTETFCNVFLSIESLFKLLIVKQIGFEIRYLGDSPVCF